MTTRANACCPRCSPDTVNMSVRVNLYGYCGRTCGEAEIESRECDCVLSEAQIERICNGAIDDAMEEG